MAAPVCPGAKPLMATLRARAAPPAPRRTLPARLRVPSILVDDRAAWWAPPSRRAASTAAHAQQSSDVAPLPAGAVVEELPIFPLGVVAFPGADTPLHIFEARYRILFNTLLDGADDVDAGLVTETAPWRASRSFGLCWSDGKGGVASVGTRLAIHEHAQLDGGRMAIHSKGVQRFRILSVIASAPIVTARVEILGDGDDADSPEAAAAASKVAAAFRALLALNLRLGLINRGAVESTWVPSPAASSDGSDSDGDALEPPELATLAPAALSYWVASFMAESSPMHQQALLQEDSTVARLESLLEVLEGSVSFLRAKAAVDALKLGSSESG